MLRRDGFRAWGCTFTYVLYYLNIIEKFIKILLTINNPYGILTV